LSPEEIRVFVTDFLKDELPQCTLRPSSDGNCYWLTITNELVELVRSTSSQVDSASDRFLQLAARGGCRVTFDQHAAFLDEKAELIHGRHPLVQAILKFYEKHQERVQPTARLTLATKAAPPGDYFYSLYRIQVRGARGGRFIIPVFVGIEDGMALDSETSEVLVGELQIRGETLPFDPPLEGLPIEALIEKGHEDFVRRKNERLEELRRSNEALVSSRIASLQASFERKRDAQLQRLDRGRKAGHSEIYIRMIEGGLRNMQLDYERKKRTIEEQRQLDISFDNFAAGVVRLSHEAPI
jgi:hypothetical protein